MNDGNCATSTPFSTIFKWWCYWSKLKLFIILSESFIYTISFFFWWSTHLFRIASSDFFSFLTSMLTIRFEFSRVDIFFQFKCNFQVLLFFHFLNLFIPLSPSLTRKHYLFLFYWMLAVRLWMCVCVLLKECNTPGSRAKFYFSLLLLYLIWSDNRRVSNNFVHFTTPIGKAYTSLHFTNARFFMNSRPNERINMQATETGIEIERESMIQTLLPTSFPPNSFHFSRGEFFNINGICLFNVWCLCLDFAVVSSFSSYYFLFIFFSPVVVVFYMYGIYSVAVCTIHFVTKFC